MRSALVFAVASIAGIVAAQQSAYGQCGGQGWTGPKTCVAGYTCQVQNPYYSQCIVSSRSEASQCIYSSASETATTPTVTKTSTAASQPTSPASGSGTTYKASFTEYGSGDQNGSPNCNTATTACGFYTSPGYSAAVSQNEFGVSPGAGAGPACGTCWRLTIEIDGSGNTVSNAGNSIVVQVTNLCPADGNPLCAQNGLGGTNQYGAHLNFDTCIDSHASAALFGDSGVGLGVGTAQEVSCSEWSGTVIH